MATTRRNYIGNTARSMRHRLGYNRNLTGRHSGPHYETFERGFYERMNRWSNDVNSYMRQYANTGIAWHGDVGVYVRKPGMHGLARAYDFTQIRFKNNMYVDSNKSWRAGPGQLKKYIAVHATARRHMGTVLTAYYNAQHRDHMHFDNGQVNGPIVTKRRTDTILVQSASNALNGTRLAIDGKWGTKTENAYHNLLRKFNMTRFDPKRYAGHAVVFCEYIARTGFAGKRAGEIRYGG